MYRLYCLHYDEMYRSLLVSTKRFMFDPSDELNTVHYFNSVTSFPRIEPVTSRHGCVLRRSPRIRYCTSELYAPLTSDARDSCTTVRRHLDCLSYIVHCSYANEAPCRRAVGQARATDSVGDVSHLYH